MASDSQVVEVSPWVTLIAYFLAQPEISEVFGTQVAGRHKYGDGWAARSLGLAIKPDSGPANRYLNLGSGRFEVRIYGDSYFAIDAAYQPIRKNILNFQRTSIGNALVRIISQETTPIPLDDPDLNSPFYLFFISASVAEEAIPG